MLDREKDMIAIPGFPYYFVKGAEIISQKHGRYKILKPVLTSTGYFIVCLRDSNGRQVNKKVHRLIAKAHLPDYSEDLDVDHIDRCKTNNNISNLRMVTTSENLHNTKAKGYCFNKSLNKWQAYICVNYKRIHLGYFDTEDEASKAYLEAKKLYHPTAPINQE
jgi:hypothetical protein